MLINQFLCADGKYYNYYPGVEQDRAAIFQTYLLTEDGAKFDIALSEIEDKDKPNHGW